jgi:hypothetical protein
MDSADANAARLILAVLDDPAWKDDLPRLVVGSLARQQARRVADDHGQPVGLAGAGQVLGEVRVGEGRRAAAWPRRVARRRPSTGRRRPTAASCATALARQAGHADVTHEGTGKPWLTVQSLAAIPLKAPLRAGYAITRSISAVEQKDKARWSRGDVMRVRLEVDAQSDMTWVVSATRCPAAPRCSARAWAATRPSPRAASARKAAPGRPTRSAASRPSAATSSSCRAAGT